MKIYKLTESINEDGHHVCGNCKTIKHTTNEKEAIAFVEKEFCPIVCRCMKIIEVEEQTERSIF